MVVEVYATSTSREAVAVTAPLPVWVSVPYKP